MNIHSNTERMLHTDQKKQYPPGNNYANHPQNVLFPGHNHLITTSTDNPSL